jgi:phosphatidylserine/phosphatidylglycerophosphate/cardiolipin synthase-like enzyme
MVINIAGHFNQGLFILNQERTVEPWIKSSEIFVTYSDLPQIKEWLLNNLSQAKKYVKVCSFIVNDKEVHKALIEVVNRGVAVFILTQLDDSKFSTSFLTEEEIIENRNQSHLDSVKHLYQLGAHIRAAESVHAKFILVDGERGFVTSANITAPSLNTNPESGCEIEDRESVEALERIFDIIYQQGTKYRKFISAGKNRQFIVQSETHIELNLLPQENDSKLRYTLGQSINNLYQEIVNTVKQAKGDIYISTYSITGLDSLPELIEAIGNCINNGNSIFIFCRAMNYRPDHLKACTRLATLGCHIRGDIYNHSKGIITDKKGLIFTANIDGRHGLIDGFEVGLIIETLQFEEFKRFHQWQFDTAPFQFKLSPLKQDFFDGYLYYIKEKGLNTLDIPKELEIRVETSEQQLIDILANNPIYLQVKWRKVIGLSVGYLHYDCELNNDVLTITKKQKWTKSTEKYLLQYDKITVQIIKDEQPI